MAYPSPATSFSEIEIESQPSPPYYTRSANDFEASTSASTAADTNDKSSKYYGHEVFISHRGPDVKKTFASHLYHRLLVHGVLGFLDNQEMQEGENISAQIKAVIATAAIHIAIFSPGYADSRWCLDELVHMLESKAPVIPVFYNVKAGDLRWTEGKDGVYADALRKLEKKTTYDPETHEEKRRYSSNTIENWRKALATVSEISGFELAACNGDEGVLLHKVVELLLKKVKREELDVANYPTGLDEKVRHFEDFLSQLPEKETKIAGIIGSGGIGKTTLAKKLFNRKISYYRKSCFLSDVRNSAKSGGISLVGLQRILLQRLFGCNKQIDSIDEGKKELMTRFQYFSHGMLILDDVDHLDQLDALLPGEVKDTFRPNCLILITSRDKYVLLRSGIRDSSIYKLSGLNTHHSRELFYRHAFCQPHPPHSFQYLVGLQWVAFILKSIRGHFRGNRDEAYWKAELSRIQYEKRKDTAIKVWDQSNSLVFENLQNKSLVEVDSENCIDMHDHLARNALKILWQGKKQAPLQLRELEIWAPLSKLPKSTGQLQHLEQIYISLHAKNNTISLSDEVCQTSFLKRFELINAWKMKSLPDLIGNLTNFEHLNFGLQTD